MSEQITRTMPALHPADYHHRFGAFVIDWHYRVIPLALLGFAVMIEVFPAWLQLLNHAPVRLDEIWQVVRPVVQQTWVTNSAWVCLAVYLLYHPLLELLLHGDSPGKRTMGIRVVSVDGNEPSARQILVRNLWRAIEFLPVGYLWGVFAILRSEENARTGDIMAGTRVVAGSSQR